MPAHSLTYVELDCDVYRITQFEAARVGVAPKGWTARWNANTTLLGVLNAGLPTGRGARLIKTTANARALWSFDLAPNLRDVSAVAGMILASVGSNTGPGIVLRGSGSSGSEQGYVLNVRETDVLEIVQLSAGTGSQLASVAFDVQAGNVLWLRFDAVNTGPNVLLRGKAWYGSPSDEPDAFSISFEDTTSPFTAAGLAGIQEFFTAGNTTFGHFRIRSLLGDTEETLRFAMPVAYLPPTIDCIPSVKSVAFQPATVSLGESLGQRASITVAFTDHKWADLGELYDLGTFFGKFKARRLFRRGQNIRIIRGSVGQAIVDMDARHYVTETFDGPDPQGGTFTIVAKDVLKLADDKRAQAPVLSNGQLAGSITSSATAANLEPAGIGNAEYPASGHVCIGGNEVCSFTRSGDALTLVRGQLGSVASAHNADERVQLVLYFPGDDVADIINTLLTGFTDIPASFIPLAEWQAETAANLSTIYTAAITEPTSVGKLLSELIEQAALALWWDDATRLLRLQVLKEIATNAATFNEDTILSGTLTTKEQHDKRISQIWTFYSRRDPTKSVDDEDNFRQALAKLDTEREAVYGSPEIRKIKARWVGTQPSADRLNQVQLSRFRDPPRRFTFDLFTGTPIQLGGGYRLSWWGDLDESGRRRSNGAPIQITRLAVEPDMIHVEAEEMLASGVIVLRHMVLLKTTGSVLNWTVPANYNGADSLIETLGAAGGANRKGGGGGAYAAILNLALTPLSSVQYRVGSKGLGFKFPSGPFSSSSGTDTWFNGATFGVASVGAKGGLGGDQGRTGGQASSSIGTIKFNGGTGGNDSINNGGGGGGGAAAGPHGDGGDGGDGAPGDGGSGASGGGGGSDGGSDGESASGNTPGRGGNNRFGTGRGVVGAPNGQNGGGGAGNTEFDTEGPPGDGSSEELWTQTIAPVFSAGPGSGPGAGGERSNGRSAPNYGAGGSGRGGHGNISGDGSHGIIAISWTEA